MRNDACQTNRIRKSMKYIKYIILLLIPYIIVSFVDSAYAVTPNPTTWKSCYADNNIVHSSGYTTASEACASLDRTLGIPLAWNTSNGYRNNCSISTSNNTEGYQCNTYTTSLKPIAIRVFSCPANSTYTTGAGIPPTCTCNAGFVDSQDGNSCIDEALACGENEYYDQGCHVIPACPNGHWDSSLKSCVDDPCPLHYHRLVVGGACIPDDPTCSDGFFLNNTVTPHICSPICGAGLLLNPVTNKCENRCLVGWYWVNVPPHCEYGTAPPNNGETAPNGESGTPNENGTASGTSNNPGNGSINGNGTGSGTGSNGSTGSGSGSGSGDGSADANPCPDCDPTAPAGEATSLDCPDCARETTQRANNNALNSINDKLTNSQEVFSDLEDYTNVTEQDFMDMMIEKTPFYDLTTFTPQPSAIECPTISFDGVSLGPINLAGFSMNSHCALAQQYRSEFHIFFNIVYFFLALTILLG